MQVNPRKLAAKLPDRPLKPSEVDDIVDRFEWSVQKIVFETSSNSSTSSETVYGSWGVIAASTCSGVGFEGFSASHARAPARQRRRQ